MNWQPIETAPKDGTRIIVAKQSGYVMAWASSAYWFDREKYSGWTDGVDTLATPTHWMPLPAPPGIGEYIEDHGNGAVETLSCQHCNGTGEVPAPTKCPTCGDTLVVWHPNGSGSFACPDCTAPEVKP